MAAKLPDQHVRGKGRGKGKRRRPFGESLRNAYQSVGFAPLEASDHPRAPHTFFKDSYVASFNEIPDQVGRQDHDESPVDLCQVVHHHVNGLCIVTAGSKLPEKGRIEGIEFAAKEAPHCSAGEKRKRQAKMLKGGKVDNVVTPESVLAYLQLTSGAKLPIYSCVWGTILEINSRLTVDILLDDPLLDGYFAVILPSGQFPPKTTEPANFEDEEMPVGEPEAKQRKIE